MDRKEAIELIKRHMIIHQIGKYPHIKLGEALSLAIEALDKQIPKKPRETRCALMCASCGHKITEKGCKKLNRKYCKKCGQRLLWEAEE